jgi:hypothetical protein|nr:MAG TPA: hypothetical protein [Caudoviricetes sp.]
MALFSRAKGANGHKMYCPYAVNRHLVQQTTYEYNDDNYQTLQQTIEHNTAEFVECKKELCGAWHDGKCHYNQVD